MTGTFTAPLQVEYLDGRRWRLVLEFDFASEVLERIVRVPAGFITDFASIPRMLWPLLPPTGRYGKAAVVHDALYRRPDLYSPAVSRLQADRTLLEGMLALRVPWLTRRVIYLGVRLGGWPSYHRHKAS